MIKDTIGNNFGLDNFLHNNVKVNLDDYLKQEKQNLLKDINSQLEELYQVLRMQHRLKQMVWHMEQN